MTFFMFKSPNPKRLFTIIRPDNRVLMAAVYKYLLNLKSTCCTASMPGTMWQIDSLDRQPTGEAADNSP